MKLKFNLKIVKELKELGFTSRNIEDNFRFYNDHNEISIDHNDLDKEYLSALEKWTKDNTNVKYSNGILQSLSMIKSIEKDIDGKFPKRLDALEEAIKSWMTQNHINFYLYRIDNLGFFHPYLVTSVTYHPKTDKDSPAVVRINMKYINRNKEQISYLSYYSHDLQRFDTIKELLASDNYYHEDEAITNKYELQIAKFKEICTKFGVQYLAHGYGVGEYSVGISMVRDGKKSKVIQDFEIKGGLQSVYSNISFWDFTKKEKDDDKSVIIPIHPYIKVFDLHVHNNFWCHVDNLTEYTYDPKLIDKLILPEEIKEIIGILSENVGNNIKDIIEGKSNGIFMLLKGLPGTGKTLSAEVYSEVIGKPLYTVQSAQLGVEPLKLEENLKVILGRAQAWGAILHIDEVDVYMKERDSDLIQNAVVGVWLRILEYYRGMLIATTNRETCIDEAILSRATAIIQYPVPNKKDSRIIWENLAKENNLNLPKEIIDFCLERFDKITGRSIKNLINLSRNLMVKENATTITRKIIEKAAIYTYINGENKNVTNE